MAESNTNRYQNTTKKKTFPFSVKYVVDPKFPIKSCAGSNRLYNSRNLTFYYLLHLADWTIHTNNKGFYQYIKKQQFHQIESTSTIPNTKFTISKMLTDILVKQKILPSRARSKYFYRIRMLFMEKLLAVENRRNSESNQNRKTITFFRFSYKRRAFYIGFYLPCHCSAKLPAPYCMSNNRWRCPSHCHKINHTENQEKCNRSQSSIEPSQLFCGHNKEIYNNRLGVSYTTQYKWLGPLSLRKYYQNVKNYPQQSSIQQHRLKLYMKKDNPSSKNIRFCYDRIQTLKNYIDLAILEDEHLTLQELTNLFALHPHHNDNNPRHCWKLSSLVQYLSQEQIDYLKGKKEKTQ